MSNDNSYRAAIIGTGRIGNSYDDEIIERQPASYYQDENRHPGLYVTLPVNHAAAYQSTPGFRLVAAANRGKEKLNAFGKRRGIQALYTDFRQLLREEQPDVVSVCTQSPEKAEVTIAAAEAGAKAIIVEKALATSMAEADAMLAACKAHNVRLVVNHPYRFSPLVRQAKALVDQGTIGELTSVTVHAGGGMLHVGTHTFDLMRYFAGDAVELYANVPGYRAAQDLPADGMVTFANGTTGLFTHSHREPQSIEIRGKQGHITLSSMLGDGWLYRVVPTQPPAAKRQYPERLTMEPITPEAHTLSMTQRLLAELADTLRTDTLRTDTLRTDTSRTGTLHTDRSFLSTGRDGAAALELGLACYASHLAGCAVKVPLTDRDLRVPNR